MLFVCLLLLFVVGRVVAVGSLGFCLCGWLFGWLFVCLFVCLFVDVVCAFGVCCKCWLFGCVRVLCFVFDFALVAVVV